MKSLVRMKSGLGQLATRGRGPDATLPEAHDGAKAKVGNTISRGFAGICAAAFAFAATAPDQASAQTNIIQNSGFEDTTGPSFGNNIGLSITPWVLGAGDDANVVRVDGDPGGQSLTGFTFGPEFDAQNNGTGLSAVANQHYLDIANGSNQFYQSFVAPLCGDSVTGSVRQYTASGWFSLRAGPNGGPADSGNIAIREGVGVNGTLAPGGSVDVAIPDQSGRSDAWFFGSTTVELEQGGTFSYVVDMGNNVNFDEASLVLDSCVVTAADDSVTVPGVSGGTSVISILDNDTIDGGTATETSVVITPGTPANPPSTGSITINSDGTVTVAANTTPGTFVIPYTICDIQDSTNCEMASVTVVVGEQPVLTAAPEADRPVTTNAADQTAGNVLDAANDTIDGDAADPSATGNVVLTQVAADPGLSLDPLTGEITVAGGTPAGTLTITYRIADPADPDNFVEATETVVVGSVPQELPVAEDDLITGLATGEDAVINLFLDNGSGEDADPDGNLDPTSVALIDPATGDPVTTLEVVGEGTWTVNPVSGAVTFSPEDGFTGNPTPIGYTVDDNDGNTSNIATITLEFVQPTVITANQDGTITFDGTTGGTSAISVLTNDTLGGVAITDPSLITLTPVSLPDPVDGSISLNPDGTVTVATGTTPGIYTLVYEICEAGDPTNCSTTEVLVEVVDLDQGLIAEIEEDLESILEEDLANTLTTQSNQISGYSADALNRLQNRGPGNQCLAAVNARLAQENILFDVDRAIIKPESFQTLDELTEILLGCPGSAFEIAGHTDSDASDAYNLDLSQRRVTAVLQALRDRGLDTTGYTARGYGESQPIASNDTLAGKAQNRRVEFRNLDNTDIQQTAYSCEDSFSLTRDFDAQANGEGTSFDGLFARDKHDCVTDRREVFEGTLSYLDTDTGQTQTALNLSYRRERYRGNDSVFGYFGGLYASRSDVTRLADGEIDGAGLNGGIYGANRLESELFVDYYLGAAAGRHTFDLAFERDIGTIDASGDFEYFAGFAGAALSGQTEVGETILKPRVGFDYVYTPETEADVVAELGTLSEVGNLELDEISGGRIFAEVRGDREIQDGRANMWITPRVSCYQSLGALDGVCGVGGSIGIESVNEDSDLTYAFEIDGEWGEDYGTGSASLSVSREVGIGALSGNAGLTSDSAANVAARYQVDF